MNWQRYCLDFSAHLGILSPVTKTFSYLSLTVFEKLACTQDFLLNWPIYSAPGHKYANIKCLYESKCLYCFYHPVLAWLARLVDRRTYSPGVAGSNPTGTSKKFIHDSLMLDTLSAGHLSLISDSSKEAVLCLGRNWFGYPGMPVTYTGVPFDPE